MKIRNIKIITAFVIGFFVFKSLAGQVYQLPIKKTITWNRSYGERTFTFEVKKGTKLLTMNFEGEISEGAMKLSLKNPKGYKLSGFSLLTSDGVYQPTSKQMLKEKADRDLEHERVRAAQRSREREKARANRYTYSSSSSSNTHWSSNSYSVSTATEEGVNVEVNNTADSTVINNEVGIRKNDKSVIKTEATDEGARGEMNKEIENPEPGFWSIIIGVNQTSGLLKIAVD